MKIFINSLLILIFFLSYNCKKSYVTPTMPHTPTDPVAPKQYKIKYLALGDSYTIGQSVPTTARYPNLLVDALKSKGVTVEELNIIARTGWTTKDLQEAIENSEFKNNQYGLVSLLIGVNNQYQGRSIEEYKIGFKKLINTAVKFAGGNKDKVFVISIPDYGYTPSGESGRANISTEIDSFNKVNSDITDSLEIKYFDITPISRKGLIDTELVADDGLHPSEKMFKQWVQLMLAEVYSLVQKD